MVAADMDSGLYREVNDCLEQIRQAASMNSPGIVVQHRSACSGAQ
jgi:hypothetical protein